MTELFGDPKSDALKWVGNKPPEVKGKLKPEEEKEMRAYLEKMAEWAKKNVGSAGEPSMLAKGGPGDSDCISTFLASIFNAAGMKTRFVAAQSPQGIMGASGVYVEVFHPKYNGGTWISVLPFAPFIFEGPQIFKSPRVLEHQL